MISQNGLVYIEIRRKSLRSDDCCEWLRCLFHTITEPLYIFVVVYDNSPVHSALETLFQEEEFLSASLLRASPYSAPLTHVGVPWKLRSSNVWQQQRLYCWIGVTQAEHWLRFLESAIDDSIRTITLRLCLRTYNHIQRHFWEVITIEDFQMEKVFKFFNGVFFFFVR